ncbi:MAG TPA: TonB family protein [Thermoanaerobaculia bacterium]|nr:TonB family protein [Thermoanaerobaculia bacterium]
MSASAPSPRPFGPYVLTHALGTDALGEAWRAGTAGAPRLKPFLHVRTFTAVAIDRSALLSAMEAAVALVDDVQGPAVARGTVMGAIDDIPFLGTLYVEGRTLDHLLAGRLLGSPLPVEHGLLIAERLLTALEAGAPVERITGAAHGFLVPAFVSISNEGEARVFGYGLGAGLLPALKNVRTRQTFGPYVAPEVLAEGKPSTPGDLYSVGAILYEALTGRAPPPGVALESVEGANLAMDGTPVPEDIRRLLRRALHPDPRMRDRQISVFRRDLSALLYGGPYAPSTFNLAFFLQRHFDKAIQREKLELAAEEEIDPKSLAIPPGPSPAPVIGPLQAPAVEGSGSRRVESSTGSRRLESSTGSRRLPVPPVRPPERTPRSGPVPVRAVAGPAPKKPLGGAPLWAVALGAVLLLAGGAYFALRPSAPPPLPVPTPVPVPTPAPPTPVPTPAPVVVGKEDPLFVAAVEKKLQEELKKREAKVAREQEAAAKKRRAEIERTSEEAGKSEETQESARALREKSDREEAARLAREAVARRKAEVQQAAAAAAPPPVKDGDLVETDLIDTPPVSIRQVSPQATRLAIQRHISGTVLLRVLVDENGEPAKVEILRDTVLKAGLGEASRAALAQWRWKPATKDGHKVKVWIVVQVPFKN